MWNWNQLGHKNPHHVSQWDGIPSYRQGNDGGYKSQDEKQITYG